MSRRAAICVGVNRAGSMTPLQAATQGAREFEQWAKDQGCDTTLLIDDANSRVAVMDILDAVQQRVDAGTYRQLIVYFSGHGILIAPGTEYWLLSRAPQNPNEAVNVSRSVVEARNSGIPHVVLISDACRSSVTGPPLSGVTGGVIFPNRPFAPTPGEVDVYYATRPGDPAYEVPEAEATQRYRGIFTDALLAVVKAPPSSLVEAAQIENKSTNVISSRKLKDHLEATVPIGAAEISVKLRQAPQVIVETALPKYFAEVRGATTAAPPTRPGVMPSPTIDRALFALKKAQFAEATTPLSPSDAALALDAGLSKQIDGVLASHGRGHFETMTGFTVFGVENIDAYPQRWHADAPFQEYLGEESLHIRLHQPFSEEELHEPSAIVFAFDGKIGATLAILPGFIGTVIVENGGVTSVSYVPSDQTDRYRESQQEEKKLGEMRAFAAVASRNGHFTVTSDPAQFAGRIRQVKGVDPTMGLYAAYAYAQAGRFKDVYSVYTYMWNDQIELPSAIRWRDYVRLPIPFDVCMLANQYTSRMPPGNTLPIERFAPFCPMLAQGWALLDPSDPMYRPIHRDLRPHLIPSLWTTINYEGVQIAREAIESGAV